jgi:hypothetical protein
MLFFMEKQHMIPIMLAASIILAGFIPLQFVKGINTLSKPASPTGSNMTVPSANTTGGGLMQCVAYGTCPLRASPTGSNMTVPSANTTGGGLMQGASPTGGGGGGTQGGIQGGGNGNTQGGTQGSGSGNTQGGGG